MCVFDRSLPGSSVHGILQTRIPEWVAISFSRKPSQPGNQTQVSRIVGRLFTYWAAWEACVYIYIYVYVYLCICVYTHTHTHIYNIYEHLVFLSLVKGYLDCFHLLVLESNSAMNMDIDIPTWVPAFNSLVYVSRNKIIGSYDNSMYNSLKDHHIVIHNDLPFFTILPTMLNGSIFPHLCQQLLFSALFVITIIVYNT